MDENRKKSIALMANQIAEENGFLNCKVDIIQIASRLGFKVFPLVNDAPFDGLLVASESGAPIIKGGEYSKLIAIKRNQEKEQVRFIIAHELGHYFLHRKNGRDICNFKYHNLDSNKDDSEEMEANYFAACLLVPEKLLREVFQKYSANNDEAYAIASTANYFEVTVACIQKRLKEVGLVS